MRIKAFIHNNYKLLFICMVLAVIGHSYFLRNQILDNQYMMGPYDQFSQMIIFKDFLYDHFSQGDFFYSFNFNGGSNILARLSYYYATSLVFYATALFTYILEGLNIIQSPSMVYWAGLSVFISVVRSGVILLITTKYINIFTKNEKISLLGATFYTFSSIYFRHAALWEFFADAMIWLPIILLGVEHIIRRRDGKLFTIGVALTMFNNGYFAFANLLFAFIYILLRFFFKLSSEEKSISQQLKSYIVYGLFGVGLSLPGFLPFVKGFFNTSRLSPEFSIPVFELIDFNLGNLLLDDPIQILPILFVFVITYLLNYKSAVFRFFSFFSFILIVLRYSPFVASLFNGLSYPQYRWHYATFLMMAIVIAAGVQKIIKDVRVNLRMSALYLTISLLVTVGVYYIADGQLEEHYFDMTIVYGVIVMVSVLFILNSMKTSKIKHIAFPLLFIGSLYAVFRTNEQLYDEYNLSTMDYEKIYRAFDDPDNSYEKALNVIENDSKRFHRIDFTDMRNLGTQKDFSSFNIYNSFHNHHQQYFYRYFQIINSRENNGTIDGLAGRQILSSLFQSDYVIATEATQYIIPTGFEEIDAVDDLSIHKNLIPLAYIHPVHNLYSADELEDNDFKDELLVNGAIVPDEFSNTAIEDVSKPNEIGHSITQIGTDSEGSKLLKSDDYYDVTINLDAQIDYDDVVIDYTIKPLDDSEANTYTYSINDYSIQLKSTGNPYSSQLYRHQAHVPFSEEIIFNLAPGTDYIFEVHSIYGVSHDELIERSQSDQQLNYEVQLDHGEIEIMFDNDQDYPLMVLPLFYESGWDLEINGENGRVLNVNNGMVGFEIPDGIVDISLKYRQPFFMETIIISVGSLLGLIYFEKRKKA